MNTTALLVLTLVEAVALVAALAVYLVVLTRWLRPLAAELDELASRVGTIEHGVNGANPDLARLREQLEQTSDELSTIAGKAENLAAGR